MLSSVQGKNTIAHKSQNKTTKHLLHHSPSNSLSHHQLFSVCFTCLRQLPIDYSYHCQVPPNPHRRQKSQAPCLVLFECSPHNRNVEHQWTSSDIMQAINNSNNKYLTLPCKNIFRGQSWKQACLWLPLVVFYKMIKNVNNIIENYLESYIYLSITTTHLQTDEQTLCRWPPPWPTQSLKWVLQILQIYLSSSVSFSIQRVLTTLGAF